MPGLQFCNFPSVSNLDNIGARPPILQTVTNVSARACNSAICRNKLVEPGLCDANFVLISEPHSLTVESPAGLAED